MCVHFHTCTYLWSIFSEHISISPLIRKGISQPKLVEILISVLQDRPLLSVGSLSGLDLFYSLCDSDSFFFVAIGTVVVTAITHI